MSVRVDCPVRTNGTFEGPIWDSENNVLCFVEFFGNEKDGIHRWDPSSNVVESLKSPDPCVSVAVPTDKGRILFAAGHRLAFIDPRTKVVEEITTIESGTQNRLNDGKCDPEGRFWIGTMEPISDVPGPDSFSAPGRGALYCLTKDRTVTRHVDKVRISNGLAWSEESMYYIDSLKRTVDAFEYDSASGEISNRRVAVDTSAEVGFPDGMCIDAEGMLWVAFFDGWKVVRFNPKTGTKISEVKFPAQKITSCCWGGPDPDRLYVTSIRKYLTEEELKLQPGAGSVFTVTGLGVRGVKNVLFRE